MFEGEGHGPRPEGSSYPSGRIELRGHVMAGVRATTTLAGHTPYLPSRDAPASPLGERDRGAVETVW
jgi:hypothetical protein